MGARFTSDHRPWQRSAGLFALALFCVLVIALLQRSGWFDPLNIRAMTAAGAGRASAPWVTPAMSAASIMGDTPGRLLIMVAAALALLWRRQRYAARWLVLVTVGGTFLNTGLKQVFAEPRPDLLPHLDIVHSYSFPSGHSAGTMILLGALAMLVRSRPGYLTAGIFIALIGISRVWLGVHWPSDVMAGWIEGLGWLCLCRYWLPAGGGEQQRVA